MARASYTDLMAGLSAGKDGYLQTVLPETWMQGRTTYGGLTAALSLESAKPLVSDLPVRSAQVAFVGPVGGAVEIQARLLRRGKNSAFVSVDLVAEGAVAAQCIFAFGAPRQSQLGFQNLPMPFTPTPEESEPLFPGNSPLIPGYMNNFDMHLGLGQRPVSGTKDTSIGLWLRHRGGDVPMDATSILAIADCPPPAALSMQSTFAPISSMTWMAEFLTDDFATDDGWWFSQSTADTATDGYSSQAMTLWNRSGDPIMIGRQTVAIFG